MKDLVDFYLIVNKYKAYQIADKYNTDYAKLVEAIKCLALVANNYLKVSEKKRNAIKINEIEWKMTKLLKTVGQEETAAKIHIKNREYEFAHKAYQMAFVRLTCKRDSKAEKLLAWGQEFEKAFHYSLAESFYRKAMSYALVIPMKQKALRAQLDCGDRMRTGPS
mgnify:CR=1 FL=1